MHPENHTRDSAILLHELYNEMRKLGSEHGIELPQGPSEDMALNYRKNYETKAIHKGSTIIELPLELFHILLVNQLIKDSIGDLCSQCFFFGWPSILLLWYMRSLSELYNSKNKVHGGIRSVVISVLPQGIKHSGGAGVFNDFPSRTISLLWRVEPNVATNDARSARDSHDMIL
nr:hypothetical protein [Tanacetum cinerariifolium]